MKKQIAVVLMAFLSVFFLPSCGKPEAEEIAPFCLTKENAGDYISNLGPYQDLEVHAVKAELTDSEVQYYADYYYRKCCEETEGMLDENGEPVPMTDAVVALFDTEVYTTVNEFMVFVRNTVEEYNEYVYEQSIVDQVMKECVAGSTFNDIPEELVAVEKERVYDENREAATQYDIDVEYYLELAEISADEVALQYAKEDIVRFAIARDREFDDLSEEDLKEEVFKYILSVTKVAD